MITCAAPNNSTEEKYAGVLGSENLDALLDRIKFVLNIAMDNHVDTLINQPPHTRDFSRE